MTHLIEENKFEELKEVLKNSPEYKIHSYLLEVLNDINHLCPIINFVL